MILGHKLRRIKLQVLGVMALLFMCFANSSVVNAADNAETMEYKFETQVLEEWSNGFKGRIIIENTGAEAIENWAIRFQMNHDIENIWNGSIYSYNDGMYIVKNSKYNEDIAAGQSIMVEFIASKQEDDKVNIPENIQFAMGIKTVDNDRYSVSYSQNMIQIENKSETSIEDWVVKFKNTDSINIYAGASIFSNTNDEYLIKNAGYNSNILPGQIIYINVDKEVKFEDDLELYEIVVYDFEDYEYEDEVEEDIEETEEVIQEEENNELEIVNYNSRAAYSKASLKADLKKIVKAQAGWTKYLRTYTPEKCVDIILQYDSTITTYANRFDMPKAYVQSILMRELAWHYAQDTVADSLVVQYYSYQQRLEDYMKLPWYKQVIVGAPKPTVGMRDDSSTGYGQIFAKTAIDANNYLVNVKLYNGSIIDHKKWKTKKSVWYSLKDSPTTNIRYVAMVLKYESHHVNVKNMNTTSATNIKKILSKYNGTGSAATKYGNEVYEYYKLFTKYNNR